MAYLVINDVIFSDEIDDVESIRDEVSFEQSAFMTSHNFSDLVAFAKRLQALIIMEPGTHPNAVGMGVGIRNYLMEFGDPITIGEIRSRIESQIEKYVPNNVISSIEVMFNPLADDNNNLYIFFEISEGNELGIEQERFALKLSPAKENDTKFLTDFKASILI